MHNIRLLPDLLINQIAAGEVVQRPASVVKELLDNAIDAKSQSIQVIVKEAGKQSIQVIDDGHGMDEADLVLCFQKHATSKIAEPNDLSTIATMGFRGEAMASIAAISQVEMATRVQHTSIGHMIVIEGGVVKKKEPIVTPIGTNICVEHLFFNTPARRLFLKKNGVEFKHILDQVQYAALSRPDLDFKLVHNDTLIYSLQREKLFHRIVHLFGKTYQKQLLPCQESTTLLHIEGYIGKPEQAKKTRGEQFLFVNRRFIKSSFLNHAIKNGYDRTLPADYFPFYAIFLTMDPKLVDVNVHPSKVEVKFQDEKMIYAVLQAVVRKALAVHQVSDAIDFEQNVNFLPLTFNHPMEVPTVKYAPVQRMAFDTTFRQHQPYQPSGVEQLFFEDKKEPPHQQERFVSEAAFPKPNSASYALQLYQRYIVTQIQSGVLLIDQQAAHERVLYDTFSIHVDQQSSTSQQLLIPEQLTLNPSDHALAMAHQAMLKRFGFVIEPFGSNTLVIHGHPMELNQQPIKPLFEAIIEQFKWNNTQFSLSIQESLLRALAKKASIQCGKKLSELEVNALLAGLFSSTNTMYTPDGRKICTKLSQEELIHLFKSK